MIMRRRSFKDSYGPIIVEGVRIFPEKPYCMNDYLM